ncbi:MAG: FG-GAP-like repeat-containing protein [Ferruginibacter sp.]
MFTVQTYAQPSINSFSPVSAAPLTQVTINGSGFNIIPDSNIVFFGAVRGTVLNADVNNLTVTVPVGATYSLISVTNNGLISHSKLPFIPSFPGSISLFDSTSFAKPVVFKVSPWPADIGINDFDNDGKADIIIADSLSEISLFHNASIPGIINTNSLAVDSGIKENYPFALNEIEDFTGDGRQDIFLANSISSNQYLNVNNSTPEKILFNETSFFTERYSDKFAFADLNNDGKQDILKFFAKGYVIVRFSFIRNDCNPDGTVRFKVGQDISSGGTPSAVFRNSDIKMTDIDGDQKPDMVILSADSNKIFISPNNSSPPNISFATNIVFETGSQPWKMLFSDIDGDGLIDIVTSNASSATISVLRNTSSTGNISFAPKVDFTTGISLLSMDVGDLDGDGRPDIAIAAGYSGDKKLSLLKNKSTPGFINFENRVLYEGAVDMRDIAIADIDGDKKQDILIAARENGGTLLILRNSISEPVALSVCPLSAGKVIQSGLTASNYKWQASTDSVNFSDIADNINYSGTNTATLQINNISSAWYGYQYRCIAGNTTSKIFELKFTNTWTGAVSDAWENAANWSCTAVPDANTDVIINTGNVTVNSDVSCRSITISPLANLTVNTGHKLTVTH